MSSSGPALRCLTLSVAAIIWASVCAASPLTNGNVLSIPERLHNASSLHVPSNDWNLAESVQSEINYINTSSPYPDFHGKVELLSMQASSKHVQPRPLHVKDFHDLAMVVTIPHPDTRFPFLYCRTAVASEEWMSSKIATRQGHSNWGRVNIYSYQWDKLQEMMSIEEAESHLKASRYDGSIDYVVALKRGNTEATAKLGYWFWMNDPILRVAYKFVLVNARSGQVTLED